MKISTTEGIAVSKALHKMLEESEADIDGPSVYDLTDKIQDIAEKWEKQAQKEVNKTIVQYIQSLLAEASVEISPSEKGFLHVHFSMPLGDNFLVVDTNLRDDLEMWDWSFNDIRPLVAALRRAADFLEG